MAEKKNIFGKDAFVGDEIPVEVPYHDSTLTLLVKPLGFMTLQNIYATGGEDVLAKIVVASVKDKEGNRFTLDEVKDLKKEIAEPLLKAVMEAQGLGGEEKN